MNEKQMHDTVVKHIHELGLLKRADDKFSRYDAEHNQCIVEYKSRRKFYKTTQIEKDKLEANMRIAEDKNKAFLYIVFDGYDKIQVFNISKLVEQDYDFQWGTKWCPATTDFGGQAMNGVKIPKDVGEICWSKAMRTIKLKRKDDVKKSEVKAENQENSGFNYDMDMEI